MIRISSAFFAALVAILAISGCKRIQNVREVTSDVSYRRVVSLSPSSTELMALMPYVELIGRTKSCNYPLGLRGEIVMDGVKPKYEEILRMRPDVIVYDGDIVSKEDLQKFVDAKIPIVDTGAGTTLEEFDNTVRGFAKFSHGEYMMSSYFDQVSREIGKARSNEITPHPKVAVLLPGKGSEHMIAGTESTPAMIVNLSGGEFVGVPGRLFQPLNAEAFMKLNPDVIVVAGDPTSVKADPRFKTMTAFQKGRIAPLLPDVIIRKGGRVNVAIKNMAATILQEMRK